MSAAPSETSRQQLGPADLQGIAFRQKAVPDAGPGPDTDPHESRRQVVLLARRADASLNDRRQICPA